MRLLLSLALCSGLAAGAAIAPRAESVSNTTGNSTSSLSAGVYSTSAVEFLRALPKVEHHIHIEGALTPELLFKLAERNNVTLPAGNFSSPDAVRERYRHFSGLEDFVSVSEQEMIVFLEEEDYADLAYNYLERSHWDGLKYAEVNFLPEGHTSRGISLDTVIGGLKKGLARGEADFNISTQLFACFSKTHDHNATIQTIDQLAPYAQSGDLIGLASELKSIYEHARSVGFEHFTIHAGETGPPDYVRQAAFDLNLTRIDHGIAAAQDLALVKELAEAGTFLTICPLSKVALKVYPAVENSPIKTFLDAGIKFSLNTDDPSFFGGYILDNYLAVHSAFNFSTATWRQIAQNSIDVCSDSAVEFLRALPKCEHHLHIEGTLEPTMLFALALKNNIPLSPEMYSTIEYLEERYCNFTSLDDFLAYFNRAMDVLLTEDDFAALSYAYLQRVAKDGLAHAEIFFDPQAHTDRGIELEVVVKGLKKGLAQGEQEFGITSALIACFEKHLPVESACEMVQSLEPYVASGDVIGLGADSTEKGNPPSKFASVYSLARTLPFPHLTMHSGEEGPAAWVRETLAMGIKRIDHGVRAADDNALLDEMAADEEVFMTLCPLSNVRLRVHGDVRESPIPKLLEKGVRFSLNSDDPAYFGGYILDNYLAVHTAFSFPKSTWRTIALNSINGSWCSAERKAELRSMLEGVMAEWEGKEI
ncbi:hypothetical protein JCM6882_006720 [Rhodosporidiobolus microsporus]